MVGDEILEALEGAVVAQPGNHTLRLHLAQLLVERDPDRALHHCAHVLSQEPDHQVGLELAAESAERVGNATRAAAYRRLLSALGFASPELVRENSPATENVVAATLQPEESRPKNETADSAESQESVLQLSIVDGGKGPPPDETGFDVERPEVRLADVGGLDSVKRRLQTAFIGPMRRPKLRRLFKKSLRGGLLLFGPPGCGKTFIARALAGELESAFVVIEISDVVRPMFGESELLLHQLFETARRSAPCVLFIDEVDALGQKRGDLRHSALRRVVAQLLLELDSVGKQNEGVFVLGATNAPWDLDPALRRPGRFDRTLLVLPPDRPAREAIFGYHLRDRPVEGGIDIRKLANRTDGYSGADLAHVCDSAAELAMADCFENDRIRPIEMADLLAAVSQVRPSTHEWLRVAKNYALFSGQGEYEELLRYIRKRGL